ncbi:MAG TPA: response regulator [Candidatus Dormibacteraeota bacterium]|nr:response regulator [Candidatus Dormibacteraeota bacterium]
MHTIVNPSPTLTSSPEDFATKANILLVDDREDNLDVLEAILKDFGQNLARARSGQEALRLLLDKDFAVILLDVRMPDMDGFETAELIRKRQRSRHTPIIFITAADSTSEQLARGYSTGAIDFIFKPYMPEVLKAKVRIFLELFNKSEEIRESELRFRTLVTNVPGALYRRKAEPPWDVSFVSDYIEKLCGYPASDFVERKRSYGSIVHRDDVDTLQTALEEAIRKKVPYALEYRILHPDGRISWVLDQGQSIVDASGKTDRLHGFIFDSTARKVAEEALRDAFARLIETQDNERSRVAVDVHDKTSPLLSGLLGKLYTLRHRSRKLDTGTAKSLEDSLKLVEDISSILRNVAQAWNTQLVERSGLLAGLRGYLSDFTKRTGIRVAVNFPQELVRLSYEVEVILFRIVQESLVNVVRYSVNPSVTVTIEPKVGDLILEVSDQGRELARGMRESKPKETVGETGFAGMRERLKQLGGDLEVRTKGTISMLTASVPIKPSRR